jgi:broad specificity phosphatase PhoE
MTILLVRHGETDGNAARVLQRADVPPNERGMRQAERLALVCSWFRSHPV